LENSLVYPDEDEDDDDGGGGGGKEDRDDRDFLHFPSTTFSRLNVVAALSCQFLRLLDFFAARGSEDADVAMLRSVIDGFPPWIPSDFDILR